MFGTNDKHCAVFWYVRFRMTEVEVLLLVSKSSPVSSWSIEQHLGLNKTRYRAVRDTNKIQ